MNTNYVIAYLVPVEYAITMIQEINAIIQLLNITKGEIAMGVFKLISKWNRASETFQAQQYILNWAKEEDLVKIEEAIKERREELVKKESKKQWW